MYKLKNDFNVPFICSNIPAANMETTESRVPLGCVEVIRIRKSKKNRQHNDQKKKYKRTNNDLQNIHIKLKIEEHEHH
jgi:hypothetical protein